MTGRTFHQLVVPKIFRWPILEIDRESLMAEHQGIRRTKDQNLADPYWPDLYRDVKSFVKSYKNRQRTTPQGKTVVAPLGNMPNIRTPFEHVAVDTIGLFSPNPDRGSRYIPVLIDFPNH